MGVSTVSVVQCDGPMCNNYGTGRTAADARSRIKAKWYRTADMSFDFCSLECHDRFVVVTNAQLKERTDDGGDTPR